MASCGKCLHKEVCVDYRYYKPIAEKCQHFKEFNVDKKLQTNADHIRAMSDDELAELLNINRGVCFDSIEGALMWLKDYKE